MELKVVYNPRVLKNMMEICAEMGIGKETAREWIDLGAPISIEQDGGRPRYSAELAALQRWRMDFFARRK